MTSTLTALSPVPLLALLPALPLLLLCQPSSDGGGCLYLEPDYRPRHLGHPARRPSAGDSVSISSTGRTRRISWWRGAPPGATVTAGEAEAATRCSTTERWGTGTSAPLRAVGVAPPHGRLRLRMYVNTMDNVFSVLKHESTMDNA